MEVASGNCDIALAMGVEKLFCGDSAKSAQTMAAGTIYAKYGFIFVAQYAMELKKWMEKSGATKEHFAKVTVKNTYNGSLNPKAQFQKAMTMEQVLNSRVIAEPLTQFMCSTMADGAAAAILCSKDMASKFTSKPLIDIAACELVSGTFPFSEESHEKIATRAAKKAYEKAGVGPEDIDVVEVHDAMAPAEMRIYEELNLCKPGEAVKLIDEGITALTGRMPVNPSGGLAAKGHPISATGLAQINEIVLQLRGEAGARQITNDPKIGMTENAGGWVMNDNAACAVTILKR
jgi:acetyl-CoA acyltransferase